jgi:hypothetical protein
MEEGKWSGVVTMHVLLDFIHVPAEYRTATLLAGLEVIMNILLGAATTLKGLNCNVLDHLPYGMSDRPRLWNTPTTDIT